MILAVGILGTIMYLLLDYDMRRILYYTFKVFRLLVETKVGEYNNIKIELEVNFNEDE